MAGQVWSTSSVGGYLSSQKLSKVLRDAVKETVKFRQFAGVKDASMQGTGKGQTFTWDVLNEIDGTQGVIAENQVVPEGNFTIAQGTLTVDEYAFAVPYTQKLDKFSEFPITNMIQRKLKNHTARSLDVLAHAQFDTTQLKVYPTGGTSTTGVTLSTTGTVGGTASVAYGNGHAKAIIDIMKERNIPPYIGDDYFAISWPTTLRTFKNNLELIHQYTSEGFKMIATAILTLLGIIIILQNTEPVETKLLFLSITMPRAILLMGTTLIGFALGVLVSFFFQRKEEPKDLT